MLERIAMERMPHPPELAAAAQADVAVLEQVARLLIEARDPVIFTESVGKEPQAVDALGMKLAMPDRLVVAVVRGGSFHYNPVVACFGLCEERGMPILTVIFNNHGYASPQGGLDKR